MNFIHNKTKRSKLQ